MNSHPLRSWLAVAALLTACNEDGHRAAITTTTDLAQSDSTPADMASPPPADLAAPAATGWQPSGSGLPIGEATVLAVDPVHPQTVYAGASGSGVFKSTDGGTSWTRLTIGLIDSTVQSLIVDPKAPDHIYAGTNYSLIRSTDGGLTWTLTVLDTFGATPLAISALAVDTSGASTVLYAGGLFGMARSTDGGDTFTDVSDGTFLDQINTILVDPKNPMNLFVGTESGVQRSINGGTTFAFVLSGNTAPSVYTLAISPTDSKVLFAGGIDGSGVFKSSDGGTTWAHVGPANLRVTSITATASTVYAATAGHGLFRSTDGGTTFTQSASGGLTALSQVNAVAANPSPAGAVYVACDTALNAQAGIFKSADSGVTWSAADSGVSNIAVSTIALVGADRLVYAGTGSGVFVSKDGGGSWAPSNTGLTDVNGVRYVTLLLAAPGMGGQLFALNNGQLFGTTPTSSWTLLDNPSQGIAVLTIDPSNTSTLYAASGLEDGFLFKSINGGTSWTKSNLPSNTFGIGAIAVDPKDPKVVYAATDAGTATIYRSADGGATWTDLVANVIGGIGVLAIDPTHTSTIYVGHTAGLAKTTDAHHFEEIDDGLDEGGGVPPEVNSVIIDPTAPQTVYTCGYMAVGAGGAAVFKTTNGGAHWSAAGAGLSSGGVSGLAMDPTMTNVLYAAMNLDGVYKTTSGGQ